MNIEPTAIFTALSHETRLRSLVLLMNHGELCVCELTHALGAAQPHMSRHLAALREAGLVTDRREGLWIHYSVHPQLPAWVVEILETTVAGLRDRAPFASDAASLAEMPNRPGAPRCA